MRLWTLVVLTLINSGLFAQFRKPDYISIAPKTGFLIAHRPFMSHLVRENSFGFESSASYQEKGADDLTKRLNNPLRSYSIEFRNFGYNEVLGSAISATSYMLFPLFVTKNNCFIDFTMGSGIGYLTRSYNELDNPLNNAIGSKLNARVNLKLSIIRYFTKTHLGTGIEFMHFSNGSLKTPNLGLNLPSFYLQFGYNFSDRERGVKRSEKPKTNLESPNNISAELIFTGKEIGAIPYEPKLYPVIATRLGYTYSKRGLWGAEFALDIIHNESNFHKYNDTTFVRKDILQIGIYGGAYIQFYKSQLAFGLGWYARDNINPEGRMYNRIGYRYYFKKNWFALFTVKANYAKADYFEFGIGYKFLTW
jgi:hypothetical protein